MGRHMVYTCDRCHAESKAAMAPTTLPTGKENCKQRWDLCSICVKEHETLLKDQEGQLRAFVAGAALPPEANLSNYPQIQLYPQQAHAGFSSPFFSGLDGSLQQGPFGYRTKPGGY